MKNYLITAAAGTILASAAFAAPQTYSLDPSHSQVVFTYNHLGFSTTTGMFSGFEGTITMDSENPENSSVSVSIDADSIQTGWEEREKHFETADFLGIEENPLITFESTSIEVTGDTTGKITGDLTMNGVTKEVTLDATMTQMGDHPMEKKPWVGFNGETTILRSEFDMGQFAPYVSDEVEVTISIEASAADI